MSSENRVDRIDTIPWLLRVKSPAEDSMPHEPCEEDVRTLPSNTLGLALSGGGIRSAAFSLGVLQALARNDWLRHVDYLSTVSGGGYTGTFVGRSFDLCHKNGDEWPGFRNPGKVQERVARDLTNLRSPSVDWLRRHSNYLAPTGVGEALFNFAAFWRNFLSLHFVFAVLFFAIFGIMNGVGYSEWWARVISGLEPVVSALSPLSATLPDDVSGSWATLTELAFWLSVVPLLIAYWLVSQDHHETYVTSIVIVAVLLAISVLLATYQPLSLAVLAAAVAWTIEAWWSIRRDEGHGDPRSRFRLVLARNHLTRRLALWATITLAFAALTLIDSCGQRLARSFLLRELTWGVIGSWFGAIGAALLALAPLLRGIAMLLASKETDSRSLLVSIGRIPYLPTLVILAVGAFFPLVVFSFLNHVAYGIGYAWRQGLATTGVAVLVSLLLGTREALPFVNRSGPLTIYAARLARVFMGAVNPERHRHRDGDNITHVIRGDDLPFDEYRPDRAGGPLHLINVAVNETMDVASLRGMRDRQAENMSVGPAGVNVAQQWHALWKRTPEHSAALEPIITKAGFPHPFLARSNEPVPVERLNVRDWMGISGAAVSPGMGRLTGTAQSLLFTIANLRLGYWWDSGLWPKQRHNLPVRIGIWNRLKRTLARYFRSQSLLVAELRGRFGGPWRRHWYLSDGGNFENTGAYELLRRRVPYIIVCDAGQDRRHQGTNLANLVRLARVDFGAEMEEIGPESDEFKAQKLAPVVQEHLGTSADLLGTSERNPAKHAVLLRFRFPDRRPECMADPWHGRTESWMLYLKATVNGDEPVDVRNYQSLNPDFPNETTRDQFFDEAQWESYRKLGEHIGSEVFV